MNNKLTKGTKMKTNNDKLRLHLFEHAEILYSSEKDQYTIKYKGETRHYVHYSKWSALFDFFNYLTSKTI